MEMEAKAGDEAMIHRLEPKDWVEEWGDGGTGVMAYPVCYTNFKTDPAWYSSALAVRLAQQLRALAAQRVDVQPNGVVHDIIDPCLNANLLAPVDHERAFSDYMAATRVGGYYDRDKRKTEDQVNGDRLFQESVRVRSSFQWVPTVIRCHYDPQTKARRAEFLGDIAGLPERFATTATEAVYATFESLFTKMLPLFAKLDLCGRTPELRYEQRDGKRFDWYLPDVPPYPHPNLDNGDLQVIFKVQEYVLPPQSTYTGRWHTEGFAEKIGAAGVYYIDVAESCSGGQLLFRPPVSPDENYANCSRRKQGVVEEQAAAKTVTAVVVAPVDSVLAMESDTTVTNIFGQKEVKQDHDGEVVVPDNVDDDARIKIPFADDDEGEKEEDDDLDFWDGYLRQVPVQTGTAVAFQNNVPHRFRTIRNDTSVPQRRLFVNFFVVNPDSPLAVTTSSVAGEDLLRRCLGRTGLTGQAGIVTRILTFVGGYANPDRLHRKVLRDKARAAMSNNRGRWGTYFFGNAGNLMYHNDCRIRYRDLVRMGNYVESEVPTSQLGSGL